jgi:hypothetical protein
MSKKIIFQDQIVTDPLNYKITATATEGVSTITPFPGTISQVGTPLSASNLNAIADECIYKLDDTSTSTTTYTANLEGLGAYYKGLTILFNPKNSNTGASTLNIQGIGTIPIMKTDNSGNIVALEQGDLIKNKYSTLVYDGTEFLMNNPSAQLAEVVTDISSLQNNINNIETQISAVQKETVKFAILTGTSNAYIATINTIQILSAGLTLEVVPNVTNTDLCTLNVNNLGAKPIKYNGNNLTSNILQAGKVYVVIYDGVQFNLQPSADILATNISTINNRFTVDETLINSKLSKSDFLNSFSGQYSGHESDYINGWRIEPDGHMEAWGYPDMVAKPVGGQAVGHITFPRAFGKICLGVIGSDAGPEGMGFGFYNITTTGCTWCTCKGVGIDGGLYAPRYRAHGLDFT